MNEGVNQVLKRVIAEPRPSRSWYILSTVLRFFLGDSGDAGILASRFLIKILKSSETQN